MKEKIKISAILTISAALIVFCLLIFNASSKSEEEETTTVKTTAATTETQTFESTSATEKTSASESTTVPTTAIVYDYDPGSVKIFDSARDLPGDEWPYVPTHRFVYYIIDTYYENLIDDRDDDIKNEWYRWSEELAKMERATKKEPTEIYLLSFIKHFDISKKDFDEATKKSKQANIEVGNDIYDEVYEPPYSDLIYTFNNEKINEYYSRDLKTAEAAYEWLQEWLKTNKPYNSYSEYLAANKK